MALKTIACVGSHPIKFVGAKNPVVCIWPSNSPRHWSLPPHVQTAATSWQSPLWSVIGQSQLLGQTIISSWPQACHFYLTPSESTIAKYKLRVKSYFHGQQVYVFNSPVTIHWGKKSVKKVSERRVWCCLNITQSLALSSSWKTQRITASPSLDFAVTPYNVCVICWGSRRHSCFPPFYSCCQQFSHLFKVQHITATE